MLSDLRIAWRGLRRTPGYLAAAAGAMALGIGASTAVFSVFYAVVLRPLPYSEPDRLVRIWEEASRLGFPENTPAPANYFDWKAQAKSFSAMAAFRRVSLTLTSAGEPMLVDAARTEAGVFPLLGVRTALGRMFTAAEDTPEGGRVVLISHSLWRTRFGSDEGVVGRRIVLDGQSRMVTGVMPAGFQIPGVEADAWVPAAFTNEEKAKRQSHYLQVIARLAPGATLSSARSEMKAIAARLEALHPDSNKELGAVVNSLREQLTGREKPMLVALLGLAGFLLLIACANVAGLIVARMLTRRREMAVRLGLGAGRGAIARLLLAECSVLASLACAGGVAAASWSRDLIAGLLPRGLHGSGEIELNAPVLAFALSATMLTVVLSSLLPAWYTVRASAPLTHAGGRDLGGRRLGLRAALIGIEVALSVLLLAGAGLFSRSLLRLQAESLGFEPAGVVTLRINLPAKGYEENSRQVAFYQRTIREIERLPGVSAAGWTYRLPTTMAGGAGAIEIDGRPALPISELPVVAHRPVSLGYFGAVRMRLKEGRWIEARDTQGPIFGAVVNDSFARRLFPAGGAIGATFHHLLERIPLRIVGICEDVREFDPMEPARPTIYPALEALPWVRDVAIRTSMGKEAMAEQVRRALREIDPALAVSHVGTMEEILAGSVAGPRLQTTLSSVFAGIALFLAVVGLAGLSARAVTERTREIGLRLALGATPAAIVALVVRQGVLPSLAGLAVGLALAAPLARVLEGLLYAVKATDAAAPAIAGGIMLLGALAALLIPALAALRIEPLTALRDE